MTRRGLALAVGVCLHLFVAAAAADPILKPRKYHGPIPQDAFSLRFGMFGGASNEEMIDHLNDLILPPFQGTNEDFGNGLTVEASYMHKPHPQFALRVNAAVSLLRSEGEGIFVPQIPNYEDSLLPALEYKREFKVELVVVEASGVYFFTDAAVKEFQPYVGGGFSIGIPHETYSETRIDTETGEPYTDEIPGLPAEASEWGVSAGAHAVGGFIYYLDNRWGVSAEGRLQVMEGRFEQLEVPNEVDEFVPANFVVDYTGFYLTLGVLYGF